MDHFHSHGLTTYSPPIVGVGPHSGDPHYEPLAGKDAAIGRDDLVLIDLWAKLDRPRAVYSDLTRMGFAGETVPEKYEEIFAVVAAARDAAIECVREAYATGRLLHGWEVDAAGRRVIEEAGYGPQFIHRIGHNIGQEVHGNGANMDNLETHDERTVLRRTCFSVEPGIYFEEFGVRSEVNVFVDGQGEVHVTGGLQQHIRRHSGRLKATRPGFEPGKTGPKPVVIPFHHRVKLMCILAAKAITGKATRRTRMTLRPASSGPCTPGSRAGRSNRRARDSHEAGTESGTGAKFRIPPIPLGDEKVSNTLRGLGGNAQDRQA